MLSHREISSRSVRLRARSARRRSGGRMLPVGDITEKTDEEAVQTDAQSNSSARLPANDPRSKIAGLPSNRCDVAVS